MRGPRTLKHPSPGLPCSPVPEQTKGEGRAASWRSSVGKGAGKDWPEIPAHQKEQAGIERPSGARVYTYHVP